MIKKVFVGNVPFQCTIDEFQDCFKKFDGFVTADIIKRFKSKLSRGFGFVEFDTEQHAQVLLNLKDMGFKDRFLRFSPYGEIKNNENKNKYQIYVSNIEKNTSNDSLKSLLINKGVDPLSCYINNKNGYATAIISVSSLTDYNNLMDDPLILNGEQLELKPFKKDKKNLNMTYSNARVAYREGFRAGQLIGIKQGQNHKNNTNSNQILDGYDNIISTINVMNAVNAL
jgi:RNA recognition motif-containing protein